MKATFPALAGGLLIMTMACTTPSDGADESAHEAGAAGEHCNAEGLDNLIGRPRSDELGAEAMRRSHSRMLRWIRPGDAVTMDFQEDRLNITLDAQGRVERFNCG